MQDVARRANVAPITVSRVINKSGYVSEATRSKVEAAIIELGYVPNRLARSLRIKQTHTLALVLTDITNPFWTTVARSVEDAANQAGFSVFLCNTDESLTKQDAYLQVLVQRQVDGILLVPAELNVNHVDLIQGQETPVVILDRRVSYGGVDVVRCDSVHGAFQIVQHLIDLGHRRIAVLSGPAEVSTSIDRIEGFDRAMRGADIHIRPEWVQTGDFTPESGYQMIQRLLALEPRPTAFFAVNNFIALGALRALRDVGLHVPQDISLVAFDDFASEFVVDPFLTVVDQPAYKMGKRATELLLSRLSADMDEPFQNLVLPVKLIVRHSTAPPAV